MLAPDDLDRPTALLGGLSPARFMRRHWHKQALLVRQALPGIRPPVSRSELFALAARDDVPSRLVQREGSGRDTVWTLRHGPMKRSALPPVRQPGWTLLVQGLEEQGGAARALLDRFRFVPEARLDDLMISWASEGGGVGPHVDSYDVFLIQVHGQRRWRYARTPDMRLVPGLPLKILQHFEPEYECVLEPGDMLYLPPLWSHDGDAVGGECMTCSVGFRSPARDELARELLVRLADQVGDRNDDADDAVPSSHAAGRGALYRDPKQPATPRPGQVPQALRDYAIDAVRRQLSVPGALDLALGEYLSEPKRHVWFPPGASLNGNTAVVLDARSHMLYDEHRIFLNGEAWQARGADARLMRQLADARRLQAHEVAGASADARELLSQWMRQGWLRPAEERHE